MLVYLFPILLFILILIAIILFFIWGFSLVKEKRYTLGIFLLACAVLPFILLIYFKVSIKHEAKEQEILKKRNDALTVESYKKHFNELQEEFKTQKVLYSVNFNFGISFKDKNYTVYSAPTGTPAGTGLNMEFSRFVSQHLIGENVTVVLPSEDIFLEKYCCMGRVGTEYNYADFIPATVLFKGKSIFELFLEDKAKKETKLPSP